MNVLFIIADDLRPDLGAYGDALAVTPNLDRLASEALVFNRAYCQKAVCWPSRNSFFSGLMPASLGKKTNAFATFRSDHPDLVALPQLFKNNGWYTRGFGKILHNGQDDPVSWSEPYFTPEPLHYAAKENLGKHPIINKSVPENRVNPLFESADVKDDAYEDGLTAKAAREAIRDAAVRDEPFFMMVGFHKPHTPFNAPKKYWDLYDRESIPLAEFLNPPQNVNKLFAVHNSDYVRSFQDIPESGLFPDKLAREIKHAYYACISYVDALVGSVLAELEATGQRDNTIIVFTSDHGYQLGDHSLWSKHTNFELATRVPLLVSLPGAPLNGKSTDGLVELVDLFPTLATLCGLPLPEHLEGKDFGRLLFEPGSEGRSEAYSEFARNGAVGRSIRTDRFRYIEWREQKSGEVVARELYDHRNDPGENVNIAGDPGYAKAVSELSKQLSLR
ncbi:MAG: sulfatase [Verrucomicrobia bacterium]|nr:sulfatase [Verrucomicrobiota bacterium]MDA1066489.1 sulfatase [Verrucomicrobiota bacterium]